LFWYGSRYHPDRPFQGAALKTRKEARLLDLIGEFYGIKGPRPFAESDERRGLSSSHPRSNGPFQGAALKTHKEACLLDLIGEFYGIKGPRPFAESDERQGLSSSHYILILCTCFDQTLLNLLKRTRFDLADAFAADTVLLRQIFQGGGIIAQAAFGQDGPFTIIQSRQG